MALNQSDWEIVTCESLLRHRFDAARAFRVVLGRGAIDGPCHAIVEEGVPFRAIAEVIGRRLAISVVARSQDEAAEHFGFRGSAWHAPNPG
jgi:hypothetical protein